MMTNQSYKLGLIGTGVQGTRFLKAISKIEGAAVVCVSNTRRQPVLDIPCKDWRSMLCQTNLDGVICAANPALHHNLSWECNFLKFPLLLEKPAGLQVDDIKLMQDYKNPIMINYTHLYSPQYQLVKKAIGIHQIEKIVAIGYNDGPFRIYNSLLDYAPHQLAMCLDLIGYEEFQVKDVRVKKGTNGGFLYYLNLTLKGIPVEVIVGNGAPNKKRALLVYTSNGNYIYEAEPDYEAPLVNVLNHFISLINNPVKQSLTNTYLIHKLLDCLPTYWNKEGNQQE